MQNYEMVIEDDEQWYTQAVSLEFNRIRLIISISHRSPASRQE